MKIETFRDPYIKAEVIKDSSYENSRLITVRLTYPRIILAELNTHRALTKNTSSSRALPFESMLKRMEEGEVFIPTQVGLNKSGMQADTYLTGDDLHSFQLDWFKIFKSVAKKAVKLKNKYNVHKQTINRLLEPWMYTVSTVTATLDSWNHVIWLRNHEASQPEFQELAAKIKQAISESKPQILHFNQWHLPYVDSVEAGDNFENVKISVSCCCQTSYRKNDSSPEKALAIFEKLNLNSTDINNPPHVSPSYHVAQASSIDNENLAKLHTEFGDKWIQFGKLLEGKQIEI